MIVCIYALVRGGAQVRGKGISGEPLRLVRSGSLAAIVGDCRRRPPVTAANLRAYHAVLERVGAPLPSVLPARFMTCVADDAEVRFVLQARRETLMSALRRVRRRAQMTVRLVSRPGASATHHADERQAAARTDRGAASGAAYLRARAERAADQRRVPAFEPLRGAVARWVRAERVETRGAVSTVYHLVPRSSVAAYQRALSRAADARGVRLVVSGPYLPFAFAAPGLDIDG